jgi:rhodanese-related sulfurtransferase
MSSSAPHIDPAELAHLDAAEVIDVRTAGEFEGARVPSARNRPLDELDQHLDELRLLHDAGQELVLVCGSGARAQRAQERLASEGLERVRVLDGGMKAWQADDGPIEQDVDRWDLERQVRLVAGSIVGVSIAASVVYPPARFVAGAVGAGLVGAAVTNTCAMGMLLSKLPYNRPRSGR